MSPVPLWSRAKIDAIWADSSKSTASTQSAFPGANPRRAGREHTRCRKSRSLQPSSSPIAKLASRRRAPSPAPARRPLRTSCRPRRQFNGLPARGCRLDLARPLRLTLANSPAQAFPQPILGQASGDRPEDWCWAVSGPGRDEAIGARGGDRRGVSRRSARSEEVNERTRRGTEQ